MSEDAVLNETMKQMGQNADFNELAKKMRENPTNDFPLLRVFVDMEEVVLTELLEHQGGMIIYAKTPEKSHEEHMKENDLEEPVMNAKDGLV